MSSPGAGAEPGAVRRRARRVGAVLLPPGLVGRRTSTKVLALDSAPPEPGQSTLWPGLAGYLRATLVWPRGATRSWSWRRPGAAPPKPVPRNSVSSRAARAGPHRCPSSRGSRRYSRPPGLRAGAVAAGSAGRGALPWPRRPAGLWRGPAGPGAASAGLGPPGSTGPDPRAAGRLRRRRSARLRPSPPGAGLTGAAAAARIAAACPGEAAAEQPGYRLAELLAELVRRGTLCGWAARKEAAWQKFDPDAA